MDHVLLAALVMTATAALCAVLVPPSRVAARRFGVIDEPGHRKVHVQAMPRMGGLAGAALTFGIGLADDVLGKRFPVAVKAAGQLAAAVMLVAAGVRTSFMPSEALNVLVTLVWLVGVTNAFNLLDNMDGLAAGVAFVASGVFLINAWALGEFFSIRLLHACMVSL